MSKKLKFVGSLILFGCIFLSESFAQTPLKAAFENYFLIGAAMNKDHIFEKDAVGANIVKAQFNTITPENALKWSSIHPQIDRYDFETADRFIKFGEKNKMFVVGHTLVWHNQTPKWVLKMPKEIW